jgi:uncharacterized membrane protein YhiD involved in acid resistance
MEATTPPSVSPYLPSAPEAFGGLLDAVKASLQSRQEIQLSVFLVDIVWATALSVLLGILYVRFGRSLSNRRQFAAHFILITMTTMLVITLVKSSLSLSLGLVGALSIVRFRTAIKEPEELAYLFVAIAVGLGFGADQGRITLAAFMSIAIVIWLRSFFLRTERDQTLNFVVSGGRDSGVGLEQIIEILQNHSRKLHLRRFESGGGEIEAAFLVEFPGYESLQRATEQIRALHGDLSISYVENRGYA